MLRVPHRSINQKLASTASYPPSFNEAAHSTATTINNLQQTGLNSAKNSIANDQQNSNTMNLTKELNGSHLPPHTIQPEASSKTTQCCCFDTSNHELIINIHKKYSDLTIFCNTIGCLYSNLSISIKIGKEKAILPQIFDVRQG